MYVLYEYVCMYVDRVSAHSVSVDVLLLSGAWGVVGARWRRGPEAQVRHAPVTPLQVRGRLRDHQADTLQHQQNCE